VSYVLIRFTPISLALTCLPYGVLCAIRVYALYGRSPFVLGLLVAICLGGLINATVCLFSLDPPSVTAYRISLLFLKKKVLITTGNGPGGKVIVATSIPGIPGCRVYTPYISYVAESG
jgi:hypothetical protein